MTQPKHKKPPKEDISPAEFAERMSHKGSKRNGLKAVFPWKKRRHIARK